MMTVCIQKIGLTLSTVKMYRKQENGKYDFRQVKICYSY